MRGVHDLRLVATMLVHENVAMPVKIDAMNYYAISTLSFLAAT